MGKLLNWFKDRVNGKFEWQDLFFLTSTINSITGNKYFQDNPLGENPITNQGMGKYIENAQTGIEDGIKTGRIETLADLMGDEKEPKTEFEKDLTQMESKLGGAIDYFFGTDYEDQIKERAGLNPEPEQEIKDMTDENLGTNNIDWISWAEEQQKKAWEREDKLRAEEYARQDNAYQRAAEDARKAGINLNLMNISPAQSSSTVQNANIPNASAATTEIEEYLKTLEIFIDKELTENEGQKDRLVDLIGSIIMAIALKR